MIKLYKISGILYQTIDYNENDITYNDLIKYIKIKKHPKIEELNLDKITNNKIVCKTIINLFDYNNINNKINLYDEISVSDLFIVIIYKYHYLDFGIDFGWKLVTIKNKFVKSNVIHEDPYQIIFVDENDKEYEKMCKIVVQLHAKLLQYMNLEIFDNNVCEEICKLAIEKNPSALKYVPTNLMTEEQSKKYKIMEYDNPYTVTLPPIPYKLHYHRLLIEHYGDE